MAFFRPNNGFYNQGCNCRREVPMTSAYAVYQVASSPSVHESYLVHQPMHQGAQGAIALSADGTTITLQAGYVYQVSYMAHAYADHTFGIIPVTQGEADQRVTSIAYGTPGANTWLNVCGNYLVPAVCDTTLQFSLNAPDSGSVSGLGGTLSIVRVAAL